VLIENAFDVNAPPDRVYSFLLDVNQVVACVPGAELVDQVDPQTFKGKVKIKVGPVTVAYDGLARIAERDDAMRTAILEAEGRETTAPGSARSRSTMAVVPNGSGSTVCVSTEFTVAGRAATFGRGLTKAKPRGGTYDLAWLAISCVGISGTGQLRRPLVPLAYAVAAPWRSRQLRATARARA
jgi:carbon monoxide dehydrogenase subunit G